MNSGCPSLDCWIPAALAFRRCVARFRVTAKFSAGGRALASGGCDPLQIAVMLDLCAGGAPIAGANRFHHQCNDKPR